LCALANSDSRVVLAILSGGGYTSDDTVCLDQRFITLLHFPFTDEEVDHFIDLNKIQFARQQLLPTTENNPLLLSLAATVGNQHDLKKKK